MYNIYTANIYKWTFAVRETASLGIMGAPRVPPLNPSESIVLSGPSSLRRPPKHVAGPTPRKVQFIEALSTASYGWWNINRAYHGYHYGGPSKTPPTSYRRAFNWAPIRLRGACLSDADEKNNSSLEKNSVSFWSIPVIYY